MMVLFCTWACFFEAGLGPVPFVYLPEVWDTAARAKGTGAALGLSRIVPVVLVASFPPVSAAVGVAACFATFGVCCTLALPFIYVYCPEKAAEAGGLEAPLRGSRGSEALTGFTGPAFFSVRATGACRRVSWTQSHARVEG